MVAAKEGGRDGLVTGGRGEEWGSLWCMPIFYFLAYVTVTSVHFIIIKLYVF